MSDAPVGGSGPTRVEVVVVGAGPAGLAVGACLRRANVPLVILEQGERIGEAWHRHYEPLHLHTDKARSALPFFPFPASYPRYPSREQVIAYLEAYADHFGLRPELGQRVARARRGAEGWLTATADRTYLSRHLVIATGLNRQAFVPRWPGQEAYTGRLLHSSEYRNGTAFAGQHVLVVGFGNSGGEIALDLGEHGARAALAVRGPVNVIPREVLGLPILALAIPMSRLPPRLADALGAGVGRAMFGDLASLGLRPASDGPLTQIATRGRIPLIDVGTVRAIREGRVTVYPGIERFTERGVVFVDGRNEPFDAVVLATGFRPALEDFLEGASVVDAPGKSSRSGDGAKSPGLYLCGFNVVATGVLREIGREARDIASAIVRTQ